MGYRSLNRVFLDIQIAVNLFLFFEPCHYHKEKTNIQKGNNAPENVHGPNFKEFQPNDYKPQKAHACIFKIFSALSPRRSRYQILRVPVVHIKSASMVYTRYDTANATLSTTRVIDAMGAILAQQAILGDAAEQVDAGTANPATWTAIMAAQVALEETCDVVNPVLTRANTVAENLVDANFALATANASFEAAMTLIGGAITASPDMTSVDAQIAGLQQQINTLADADVALVARVAELETRTSNAEAFLREICPNMKIFYTAVCEPYMP